MGSHVRDRLGARRVGRHPPLFGLGDLAGELGKVLDLAADHAGLVVDVDALPIDPAPQEHRRIDRVAPVGPETVGHVPRALEFLDHPILQDERVGHQAIAAAPDVLILVRVALAVEFHLLAQHRREPRVVPIVHVDDNRVAGAILEAEELFDGIVLVLRVPREPDLRAFLADRRTKEIERATRERGSLLDPRHVVAFQRLDVPGVELLHAAKDALPAVRAVDHAALDVEILAQRVARDRLLDELFHRLVEGVLDFANAHDVAFARNQFLDHAGCEEPALGAAASASSPQVARGRE